VGAIVVTISVRLLMCLLLAIAFAEGVSSVPYIPLSVIEPFIPASVHQLAAPVKAISELNTSLATGAFAAEVCESWPTATKPFHCVEQRATYSPLAALSLACSVVATLLPAYVVVLKFLFGKLCRSKSRSRGAS